MAADVRNTLEKIYTQYKGTVNKQTSQFVQQLQVFISNPFHESFFLYWYLSDFLVLTSILTIWTSNYKLKNQGTIQKYCT